MISPPDLFFRVGRFAISAHFIFESLGYAVGFALYRRDRRRFGDSIEQHDRHSVIVAAVLGAAIGSKLLAGLEDPRALAHAPWAVLLGGKTMVGGLLGGTLAVEWIKKRLRIERRTGDLFAIPMAVGIAIGRVGCFFSGLGDHTYGSATNLPWGMDFGDGIARHPTQLYEVAFLLTLALCLAWLRRRLPRNGELFRIFLLSYLGWRLLIDFLKPEGTLFGLSAIQWACTLALLFYARDTVRMFSDRRQVQLHG
jgi:phosphatidylglycerol---prolipoprotein diacylglyceryl transferase